MTKTINEKISIEIQGERNNCVGFIADLMRTPKKYNVIIRCSL